MKNVLITGAQGFIGKNLQAVLKTRNDITLHVFDIEDSQSVLEEYLKKADFIFHLAGVNRPQNVSDYDQVNRGLTEIIIGLLKKFNKKIPVVFSSSIQANLDNPYGQSKKEAETSLIEYSKSQQSPMYIFRLPNVFGKWCRPNYNSVVATFCYNIAHGLDITISDRSTELTLVYIDHVIQEFIKVFDGFSIPNKFYYEIPQQFKITLGELADTLYNFKGIRKTLVIPDLSDDLTRFLYSTYLSYLEKDDFSYQPLMKRDDRGILAELFKSEYSGQIFISRSYPGIKRGNHYHHTKVEKFCVVKGKALIQLRHILEKEIISYQVSDEKIEIIDIPPGYTHSIENIGQEELVVLFWANEIFNEKKPDTYFKEV